MINTLIELPRIYKQIFMAVVDAVILILIILLSFAVRLGYWYLPDSGLFLIIFGAPFLAVPIFYIFRLFHEVSRYFNIESLWQVFKAVSLYAIIWGLIGFMFQFEGIPRSVILINWMLSFIGIAGVRFLARKILSNSKDIKKHQSKNVIVYGAGRSGRQLIEALNHSAEYTPIAFIDDSTNLNNQTINGIRVYDFSDIESLVKKYNVQELFLVLKHFQVL